MMRNKNLVFLGYIIPVVFWSTLIICGLIAENHNHLINMVSELGATGTKTQYIFTAGLMLSSILSIFFIVGLYRKAKEAGLNTIPILLILTFSFSIFGAAIFPLPLKLHGILDSPSMLLPLSPLLALLLWKDEKIPDIKIPTGIILIIMLLGFLTLTPNILNDYFGLKQLFFHLGWSLWFICLSLKFSEPDKKYIEKNSHE